MRFFNPKLREGAFHAARFVGVGGVILAANTTFVNADGKRQNLLGLPRYETTPGTNPLVSSSWHRVW